MTQNPQFPYNITVNRMDIHVLQILHKASLGIVEDLHEYLSANELDINTRDCDQQSALELACMYECPIEILTLLAAGASIGTVSEHYRESVIEFAVGQGVVDFLRHGAEFIGSDALFIFSKRHFLQQLIQAGVNVNLCRPSGLPLLALANDADCVQDLIQAGADVHMTDEKGSTVLMYSARLANTHAVRELLHAGVQVNAQAHNGISALMEAARLCVVGRSGERSQLIDLFLKQTVWNCSGNDNSASIAELSNNRKEILESLLRAGADINAQDQDGRTALMHAVKSDFAELDHSQFLIEQGADPNIQDKKGKTALVYALGWYKYTLEHYIQCQAGLFDWGKRTGKYAYDLDMLSLESSNYIERLLSIQETNLGKLILHCVSTLPALLAAGADPNLQDLKGETALMHAVRKHQEDCQYLIDKGADVNVQDYSGNTALMHAVQIRQVDKCVLIQKMLLQAGANPNIQDKNGVTCLMHAVNTLPVYSNSESINMFLGIETGLTVGQSGGTEETDMCQQGAICDVNLRETRGWTALIYAVFMRLDAICKRLTDIGADLNVQDEDGKTALMYAVMNRASVICKYFADHKADVNLQDNGGKTALMYAAFTDQCGICLIDNGADVNIQDKDGRTTLMYAVMNNAQDIFRCLVANKADMNLQDIDGKTALMYAASRHFCDMCTCLIDNGADVIIQDKDGKTAVLYTEDRQCLRILLTQGINFDLSDSLQGKVFDYYLSQFIARGRSAVNQPNTLPSFLIKDVSLLRKSCNSLLKESNVLTIRSTIENNRPDILQLLVCSDVMKSFHQLSYPPTWYSSAVGCALSYGRVGVVKYLIANCYLTLSDMTDMRTALNENLVGCAEEYNKRPGDVCTRTEILLRKAVNQPWPLVKLAFITVSSALSSAPDRQAQLLSTRLPDRLQRMLMFQEPISRLPVHAWDDIPLYFDLEEYEKRPKPRPLLLYWPVGEDICR